MFAGPSQQFEWIGHGTYAPLNVPNIFKAANLDTRWNPETDEIFEAGLIYDTLTPKIVVDKSTTLEIKTQAPQVSSSTHSSSLLPTQIKQLHEVPGPLDIFAEYTPAAPRFEKSVSAANREEEKADNEKDLVAASHCAVTRS